MNGSPQNSDAVLICACEQAQVYPAQSLELLIQQLQAARIPCKVIPDLCEAAGRRDESLKNWTSGNAQIVACYPRAVKWLFEAAGAPLPQNASLLNLRTESAKSIAQSLSQVRVPPSGGSVPPQPNSGAPSQLPPATPDWLAWFPVIDYDRCTQCMQCLSFCLFGVYGVDSSHQIQVQNPDQCKPGCPACSRVCPQTAIIFPKHKGGPINGAPVVEHENGSTRPKVNISALLGGDAHAMLRARSAQARTRFSKDRTPEAALSERRRYLAEQGLVADEIPPEVLMNLPAPDVIARKAKEAAARAQAALQARKQL